MNRDLQKFDYHPPDKLGKLLRGEKTLSDFHPPGISIAGASGPVAPAVPTPLVKITVKISTTNLGYKTTNRWKIVSASKYNSDRQPEISIWPPKPEIITYVEL